MSARRMWVGGLCVATLSGCAKVGVLQAPPTPSRVVVYDRLTVDQAERWLTRRGLAPELLVSEGRDTAFRMTLSGYKVLLVLGDGGSGTATNVYLYAGFDFSTSVAPATTNNWNLSARLSRAYVDAEGDPILEADLDLRGGVTEAALDRLVDEFALQLVAFVEHIGFQG